MNKLLVLIAAALLPACTIRTYTTPAGPYGYGYNQYGYGQSYAYGYYPGGAGVAPATRAPQRSYPSAYSGPFPPQSPEAAFFAATGCTNLNPNVCAARGW
jgi:hypothetical protein